MPLLTNIFEVIFRSFFTKNGFLQNAPGDLFKKIFLKIKIAYVNVDSLKLIPYRICHHVRLST